MIFLLFSDMTCKKRIEEQKYKIKKYLRYKDCNMMWFIISVSFTGNPSQNSVIFDGIYFLKHA